MTVNLVFRIVETLKGGKHLGVDRICYEAASIADLDYLKDRQTVS